MRLDKFLKTSRIIKRRPVAKMVVDSGKAIINGKVAKSGTQVKENDILEIEYYDKFFKFKILEVPSGNVTKDKSGDLVKVLEVKDLKIENEEN
ncbi:MAG: S4 domain-containing protein [Fusobacterium sp. JB021]|nr:S4 domain-containing protein [Fusobacterium sp. JB021]MDP0507186.1 S4 domain-containing protein [Fusobacterium sp. JB019]